MVSQEEHSRAVQPVAPSQKRGSAQAGIGRRNDVIEPAPRRRRPLDQTGDQGLEVLQIDLSGGVSVYGRPKPVALGAGFDPRLQPSQNVQHGAMREAGHGDQPVDRHWLPQGQSVEQRAHRPERDPPAGSQRRQLLGK